MAINGKDLRKFKSVLKSENIKNSIHDIGVQLIAIVAPIMVIPLIAHYFSEKVLAVYIFSSALIALGTLFDLGITNGITNKLSQDHALEKEDNSESITIVALSVACAISIFIFVISGLLLLFSDISNLIASKLEISTSITTELFLIIIALCLTIPSNMITRIYLSTNQSLHILLITSFNAIVINIGVIIFGVTTKSSIGVLFVTLIAPQIINLMSYYRTFSKIWARKSRGIFTLESVIALRDNSKWHYKYQIIAFLSFQIDVYILIAFLEGSLITDYQVMMKLAAVPIAILAALSRRFWIHAAGSYRDRESDFIRRKLHQLSRLVVFASLIFGVVLHLFGQQFLRLYTNDYVVISNVEFTWVAIWVAISGVAQMYDALFKGWDLIQSQIKYAYMMCILKIGLSIALILSLKSIEAPLIASSISILVLTIFPAELTLRYKFKKI